MRFFNFRRGGSNSASGAAGAAQPIVSTEVLRKRAKHRLIGATVLVLIGVVVFPLVFDTQPRPIAVDIPIEIPNKSTVPPLASVLPSAPSVTAPAPVAEAPAPAKNVAASASLSSQEEIVSSNQVVVPVDPVPPAVKSGAKAESRPEPKKEIKAEIKPSAKPQTNSNASDDTARANALLNGVTTPPPAVKTPAGAGNGDARIVVQVGAFADTGKAHEVRVKLERAGLKTYTQVADTKDGKRTRVRVGPFATKADAEKAVSKIKTLDLPATILAL